MNPGLQACCVNLMDHALEALFAVREIRLAYLEKPAVSRPGRYDDQDLAESGSARQLYHLIRVCFRDAMNEKVRLTIALEASPFHAQGQFVFSLEDVHRVWHFRRGTEHERRPRARKPELLEASGAHRPVRRSTERQEVKRN